MKSTHTAPEQATTSDEKRPETIRNCKTVSGDNDKEHKVPIALADIIETIHRVSGDWPRRVDGSLFVHDQEHGIGWLNNAAGLFGWLHRVSGGVQWYDVPGAVGRSELFAELQRTSRRYGGVETVPHEPRFEDRYYTCPDLPSGDGSHLAELLGRFAPATDIDGDLIKAAFMTALWGGPPGTRPAFLITSDSGRGAGKSTLAEIIGELFGGVLSFSQDESFSAIKTRLLSETALTQRVALVDNVKSLRFSWGDLEGLITCAGIGGHRMYCGEAVRPNTLTWFITLNGASLSTDMAQRSVVIKLNRPKRSATWLEDIRAYIATHRQAILADIATALRSDPFPLTTFTRWATWEKEVLQRLPEPNEAQRVIIERQAVVDAEHEEAETVQEFFAGQLAKFDYRPDADRVFIPAQRAAEWFKWSTDSECSITGASRQLGQLIEEGRLPCLVKSPGRAHGRGYIWRGHLSTDLTPVDYELADRLSRHREQTARG